MTRYVRFPFTSNPEDLRQAVYAYIKARSPQWNPNDGNLDTWIIQAITTEISDLRELASDVPDDVYRYFGATLMSIPPIDAAPSLVSSTWTVRDAAGYLIPAGTQVTIRDTAGNQIPFETVIDTIIPVGQVATAAGAVQLRSTNNGAETAGIGGAAVVAALLDTLDYVTAVTLTGVTTGGTDAEDDDTYLNRLTLALRLLSRRPILPSDAAILARQITGVYRAVAIDLYNPNTATYNNPRTTTVAAIDANGVDVSAPTQAAILALLNANREVNFNFFVIGATRSAIKVNFVAKAAAGYTTGDVLARATAALQAFLSPTVWGNSSNDPQDWTETTIVRYSEVAQVLSNVEGLDYWTTLQIALAAGVLGAADVNIPGPAALVTPGVITGVVN